MLDLDTLVTNPTDLYLTEANFITDRGWIVANGLHPSGEARAAILIPEDDASELTLETNPTNGGPALRPLPPYARNATFFEQPIARDLGGPHGLLPSNGCRFTGTHNCPGELCHDVRDSIAIV